MRETFDFNKPRDEACFHKGYSTADHIHAISQVLEKGAESNQPLYISFVDYEKSFDSVEILGVMEELHNEGVKEACIKLLQNIYIGCTTTMVPHRESNESPIIKRVRGGNTISPVQFTACLQVVLRNLNWDEFRITVNEEYLSNLQSNTTDELQSLIEDLERESRKVALRNNMQIKDNLQSRKKAPV